MTEPNAIIPKEKQRTLGLCVTAKEAYEKWQATAAPGPVNALDGEPVGTVPSPKTRPWRTSAICRVWVENTQGARPWLAI